MSATDLRVAYARGRALQARLDASSLNSSDEAYQTDVKEAIRAFTTASVLVAKLGVFSSNETADDVATADLQYLLVDVFLGELHTRSNGPDRLQTLRTSESYFRAFLARLEQHELLRAEDRATMEQLERGVQRDATKLREHKIAMFKREKETKAKLKMLEDRLRHNSSGDDVGDADTDEETTREHTLALIESFTITALNQLDITLQEAQMLELIAQNGPPAPRAQPPVTPGRSSGFKPIVIKDTRTVLQQQVFQPGWRQPTMTLDEFVELERQRGNIIQGGGPAQEAAMQREKEEKEYRDSDTDADKATYEARKWDEYTDDHRRGDGNRYNRS